MSEIFLILIQARYYLKCIQVFCKYPLFLSDAKLEFSQHIFEEYSNIKFHKNPSIESRDVQCGRTERRIHGQTDTDMKLMLAFRNFANAPKTHKHIIVISDRGTQFPLEDLHKIYTSACQRLQIHISVLESKGERIR